MKIGFIGLGNMADAMIGGMLKKELVKPKDIIGSAKTQATMARCREKYGIETAESNAAAAAAADILFLAVKPAFFSEVIAQIKEVVRPQTLIISIAAGKTMAWIEEAFGRKIKLLRCMLNTPALVLEGCTAYVRGELVSDAEMEKAKRLLSAFGTVWEVPESMMDAVVGVSGSSPAYVFLFIEAMADAAVLAGNAAEAGVCHGCAVCAWKRKNGVGNGAASGRTQGYGMLAGRHHHRGGKSA